MRIINTDLISSPYNWAMVLIMVLFGLIFLAIVFPQDDEG